MYQIKHLRPKLAVYGPNDRPALLHPDAHPLVHHTSLSIGPVMNSELNALHTTNAEMYSNRPDPDWIGTTSPDEVQS